MEPVHLSPALPRPDDLRRGRPDAVPLVLGGRAEVGVPLALPSPADPGDVLTVHTARRAQVARAAELADAARPVCAALTRANRATVLRGIADRVEADSEALAEVLTREVGKALRDSRGEVARCVTTLRNAADAVAALAGREVPVDAVPSGSGRIAYTTWEPVGVVAAICGFNFPLLIAVHKVSAAIGAGCPVLIKPSDRTPLTALALAGYAVDAGWPAEAISALPGGPEVGANLVEHPAVRLVTFTGSSRVGALIAAAAGHSLTRCVLELGSNTATIVAEDADLALAAERCAVGAMSTGGQSCISVQRVFAHRSVAPALAEAIADRVSRLRTGDPYSPDTEFGALISPDAQERVAAMVSDAVDRGAKVLTGGDRGQLPPTVLYDPPPGSRIGAEEAFGPVVAIYPFDDLDAAVTAANGVEYGLMTGVFTASLDTALALADRLETGGVHINDSSNYRADNMPYGGVKNSGYGKEGPASAMREMSVEKVVTLRLPR